MSSGTQNLSAFFFFFLVAILSVLFHFQSIFVASRWVQLLLMSDQSTTKSGAALPTSLRKKKLSLPCVLLDPMRAGICLCLLFTAVFSAPRAVDGTL